MVRRRADGGRGGEVLQARGRQEGEERGPVESRSVKSMTHREMTKGGGVGVGSKDSGGLSIQARRKRTENRMGRGYLFTQTALYGISGVITDRHRVSRGFAIFISSMWKLA